MRPQAGAARRSRGAVRRRWPLLLAGLACLLALSAQLRLRTLQGEASHLEARIAARTAETEAARPTRRPLSAAQVEALLEDRGLAERLLQMSSGPGGALELRLAGVDPTGLLGFLEQLAGRAGGDPVLEAEVHQAVGGGAGWDCRLLIHAPGTGGGAAD